MNNSSSLDDDENDKDKIAFRLTGIADKQTEAKDYPKLGGRFVGL